MDNDASINGNGSGKVTANFANTNINNVTRVRSALSFMTTQDFRNAVVFSNASGLDQFQIRTALVRIPEVVVRIREAQKVVDTVLSRNGLNSPDLFNSIFAEDVTFATSSFGELKALLRAIVQVALFDRYLKSQRHPDYLIGSTAKDSALLVSAGQRSFYSLVEESDFVVSLLQEDRVVVPLRAEALAPAVVSDTVPSAGVKYRVLPMAAGLKGFKTFGSVEEGEVEGESTPLESTDLHELLSALHAQSQSALNRVISIGPASGLLSFDVLGVDCMNIGADGVEVLDSIEIDPMLSWFWSSLRGSLRQLN
jgi:hypothetical protein